MDEIKIRQAMHYNVTLRSVRATTLRLKISTTLSDSMC